MMRKVPMTYQEVEAIIAAAERATLSGNQTRAATLFAKAGEAQLEFVRSLPTDRIKTKSVYAISAAALLYRARKLDSAERALAELLAGDWLPPDAAQRARDMMALIWGDRILGARNLSLAKVPLSVVFRGGAVGNGIAPSDAVDASLKTVKSIVRRCGDYMNNVSITSKASGATAMYEAWAAQPTFGSFRVDMFITRPGEQLRLDLDDGASAASPENVVDKVVEFLDGACNGDVARVTKCVENPEYRLVLARLARNLVPDGKDLGEVELGMRHDAAPRVAHVHAVRRDYVAYVVKELSAQVPGASTSQSKKDKTDSLTGVLRAVDLHTNRLRIDDLKPIAMKKELGMDDVLGPMLNKRVCASMRRGRGQSWVVEDVDLAL